MGQSVPSLLRRTLSAASGLSTFSMEPHGAMHALFCHSANPEKSEISVNGQLTLPIKTFRKSMVSHTRNT